MGEFLKTRTFFFEALKSIDKRTDLLFERTLIPKLKGFSHKGSFEK
jgi:hypothetical protein